MFALDNPICVAAGPWTGSACLDGVAAVFTKTLTLEARTCPGQFISEVDGGYLNKIGLANPGIQDYPMPKDKPVVISIYADGKNWADWIKLLEIAEDLGAAAVEINLSCPNVEKKKVDLHRLYGFLQAGTDLQIIAKVRGEQWNEWPGEWVTIGNSIPAAAFINGELREGGFSGPSLKYMNLEHVAAAADCNVKVIASGGVYREQDVADYLAAGAVGVQVGSALIKNVYAASSLADRVSLIYERSGNHSTSRSLEAETSALHS